MSRTRETLTFLGLMAFWAVSNFATLERSPTVWLDEVTYSDPGVNLAMGKGFTSSAWYSQSSEKLWAANTPLYPLLLAGWIKIVGFDILQVRSLNLLLIALSVLFVWRAMIASSMFEHAASRLAVVTLLLFGYGMTFIYRSGRPDCVSVLLFSVMLFALFLPTRRLRYLLLAFAAFVVPFAGLGALPYLALCAVFLLFLKGWHGFPEFVILGVASTLGLASLLGFYLHFGAMDDLRAGTADHSTLFLLSQGPLAVLSNWWVTIREFRGDLSLLLLLAFMIASVAASLVIRRFNVPRLTQWLVMLSLAVPAVMLALGKFPIYYGWMMFVPLIFAWAFWFDASLASGRAKGTSAALAFVAIAVVMAGLPLRTGIALSQWSQRDYQPVRRLAHGAVDPGDVVYCGSQAYYAVKGIASATFSGSYLKAITPDQAQSVTLLIIDPESLDAVVKTVGGNWIEVKSDLAVANRRNKFGASTYNLAAWRRSQD
jgi:hypothetical protein